MFDSSTPAAGGLGGMSPYLRLALQALAGGFQGTANAQRTGARGFGAGLGPGAAGGLQYGLETQQADRRNRLADQQDKYLQSKIDAETRDQQDAANLKQQTDAYIATLPPDQQQMARLAPKEVIAEQLKQMFPAGDAPKTVGGMMWDSASKSYKPIPGYTEQAQAIAAAGRAPAAAAAPIPKTIEERDQEVLLRGDPASPEYAMAYTRSFLTPHYVQTNNGVVPIMPAVPPNIRPPSYAAGDAQPAPGGATTPQAGQAIPGTAPPMSQDQSNAAGFSDRMTQAGTVLDQLGAGGKPFVPSQIDSTAGGLPGSNYTTSTQWKQFDQARRNFINAQLRRESGAAISQSEFDNANAQYFPVPNDPPEVLAQKAQNRQQAIANMKRAAGPQYQPAPAGQPQPAPQPSAPPAGGGAVQWHFENGVLVPGPAGHGASGSW